MADHDQQSSPTPSTEDRSKWRYEENGLPFIVAMAFAQWLDRLPQDLELGANVITQEAWPEMRRRALDGSLAEIRRELNHWSTKVRYPADGMAYVFAPIVHPDQDEPFAVEGPTPMYLHVVTLLWEGDRWKVHAIGSMVPPAELGRVAYSW